MEENAKDKIVYIRMDSGLYDDVKKAADKKHLDLSSFIRMRLAEMLEKETEQEK